MGGMTVTEPLVHPEADEAWTIDRLADLPEGPRYEIATAVDPADVLLAVEVVSPSNASRDTVLKRHDYAEAGTPHYWIVDHKTQTATVLALDDSGRRYVGTTEEPFPFAFDPAEIF
jgi:Uma2 family endonuclease